MAGKTKTKTIKTSMGKFTLAELRRMTRDQLLKILITSFVINNVPDHIQSRWVMEATKTEILNFLIKMNKK